MERPEDLEAYVDEHSRERSGEYETRGAWVIELRDGKYYTCKECGRVFNGSHAFSGHTTRYDSCRPEVPLSYWELRQQERQERLDVAAAELAAQPWYRFW